MNTDDILCEAPGPGGRTCTLPYGHEPGNVHAFDVELPHDLGDLIDGIMERAEQARVMYVKERRKARRAYWFAVGTIVVYLGLILLEFFT
jgi:hypothetical protein